MNARYRKRKFIFGCSHKVLHLRTYGTSVETGSDLNQTWTQIPRGLKFRLALHVRALSEGPLKFVPEHRCLAATRLQSQHVNVLFIFPASSH